MLQISQTAMEIEMETWYTKGLPSLKHIKIPHEAPDTYAGAPDYDHKVWIGPGSLWETPFMDKRFSDAKAARMYRRYFLDQSVLKNNLDELTETTLVCNCDREPCHGEIIIELWDA